jgi:hypothetical protein
MYFDVVGETLFDNIEQICNDEGVQFAVFFDVKQQGRFYLGDRSHGKIKLVADCWLFSPHTNKKKSLEGVAGFAGYKQQVIKNLSHHERVLKKFKVVFGQSGPTKAVLIGVAVVVFAQLQVVCIIHFVY